MRTVVDYIVRIAVARTLGLYERQGTETLEDRAHSASRTIRKPNDWQGEKEILESYLKDFLVYDAAYLWDMGASDGASRFLVRVPPHAVEVATDNWLKPKRYRVRFANGTWVDLEADEMIPFRGYSATGNRIGTAPMETLRQQLVEEAARQAQAIEFIRGGMVKGGIVERPIDAPEWSDAARTRFERDWASRVRGMNAGKSPVLEEGMKFVDAGVSPREAEAARSREFSLASVARMYGLHPGLFGVEGVSVDLEAARDAADEDVVVPLLLRAAEALTIGLVHRVYDDGETHYFAFGPRLETSLDRLGKAAKDLTTTVLSPDEFRGDYMNKPPLADGMGEKPILNPGTVLGGAPATPVTTDRGRPEKSLDQEIAEIRSMAERPPGKTVESEGKAQLLARRRRMEQRRDKASAEHADILRRHFRRQRKYVQEGGRDLASTRWNDELANDLLKAAKKLVSTEGPMQAERMAGAFDMARVENYLQAGAAALASAINVQTVKSITAAEDRWEEPDLGKADARKLRKITNPDIALDELDGMVAERADDLGAGRASQLVSFAALEAARQLSTRDDPRSKTWIGSGKADSRHAGVSGETVPVFSSFSNGLQYPGDPDGDLSETAKCECLLDVQ